METFKQNSKSVYYDAHIRKGVLPLMVLFVDIYLGYSGTFSLPHKLEN